MSNGQLPPVTRGAIPAAVVAQFLRSSGMTIDQLMLALIPLAQKDAIPPISNFFVGAVALGASGSIYFGANYEFVARRSALRCMASRQRRHMRSHAARPHAEARRFRSALRLLQAIFVRVDHASTLQILLPDTPPTLLTSLIPNALDRPTWV